MLSTFLFTAALLLTGDAEASKFVGGDYIQVYYNSGGMWNDYGTYKGMQINNGAWRDVTWPGSPWQQTTIEYQVGATNYNYSGNASSWSWTVSSEADTSVGTTKQATYVWTLPSLTIEKTETWIRTDKYLVAKFRVTNTGGTAITNFRIMHAHDTDQDYNAFGNFNTNNDVRADKLLATAAGSSSGLTVGYGICDPSTQDVGFTSSWSTDADAVFSDYGGASGDYAMHWRQRAPTINVGTTIDMEFVYVWDATVAGANALFDGVAGSCVPCEDGDGDGHGDPSCGGDDCNDANPTMYPGAPEICDGLDNDCDGTADEGAGCCDDVDGDGFEGAGCGGTDCDDGDPTIYPGAPETCNGYDDDCDGVRDEGLPFANWYLDSDADGFGTIRTTIIACDAPDGYVGDNTDCDDFNNDIHPGAAEVCNGLDDDCDRLIDDADPDLELGTTRPWYDDLDEDGYGDPATGVDACSPGLGEVADGTDCDDLESDVHPGASEVCNGRDDDCDGLSDDEDDSTDPASMYPWYYDGDGDTFGDPLYEAFACDPPADHVEEWTDCDDTNPAIHPDATEVCNGWDDNCDGTIDDADPALDVSTRSPWHPDSDADGFGDVDTTVDACDPPAGHLEDGTDCADADPAVNPGASEVCNEIDDDCDGLVDDADASLDAGTTSTWYADTDGDGFGDAGAASASCDPSPGTIEDATDCDDTNPAVFPGAAEVCNGIDDDCDGLSDDDDPGVDLATATTWYTDADGDSFGDPGTAVDACAPAAGAVTDATDCDDSDAAVFPGALEVCNTIDDDCDTLVDDADPGVDLTTAGTWHPDDDLDGFGDATISLEACVAPAGTLVDASDCDDGDPDVFPGAAEVCNTIDDDCDALVDDLDPDLDAGTTVPWYADVDADGFGDADAPANACSPPVGFVRDDTDCDDLDALVNPDGDEVCNGYDDDCDALVDDEDGDADPATMSTWYADNDADTFGDPSITIILCDPTAGWVADGTDCDDDVPSTFPGAVEQCNDVDDDCDVLVDEDVVDVDWFPDTDGDNYGDPSYWITDCLAPDGYVEFDTDCDDGDPAVFPGAPEVCNSMDDDCDGLVDDADDDLDVGTTVPWYADLDGDGFGDVDVPASSCAPPASFVADDTDCDDGDPLVNPDGDEVCNGYDDDCDALVDDADADADPSTMATWYGDADGDLFGDATVSARACDDPGDGWVADRTDCDDAVSTTFPGAVEQCNEVDDDCDVLVDEGVTLVNWYPDTDGDGFGDPSYWTTGCLAPSGFVEFDTDCDDGDAAVNPGAAEVCNTIDDDCDGLVDDADPTVDGAGFGTWYADSDGDGFGAPGTALGACDEPSGYTVDDSDCNDGNPAVFPGATEVCNAIDDDCDSLVDDADPDVSGGLVAWNLDRDGDGFGDPDETALGCSPPVGTVGDANDCDDGDPAIFPGAPEGCNGYDDDCDGLVDDADPDVDPSAFGTWYADVDADGFGDAAAPADSCAPGVGFVDNDTDCDDLDPLVNPDGAEVCNGWDDDCDTLVDDEDDSVDPLTFAEWHVDADGDTYGDPDVTGGACAEGPGLVADDTDCDDADATIYPGAFDLPRDGIDSDCDGAEADDADGDGFGDVIYGGPDCDDSDPLVNPDAVEVEDGVDNDCDGIVDEGTDARDDDGDGFAEHGGDCDDTDGSVHPGATEVCDGVDEDCDGVVDDGTPCVDDDGDGYSEDSGDCHDGDPAIHPGAKEVPGNGIDDDCDGDVDGLGVDSDADGFTADGGDCDEADGAVHPGAPEIADGVDNDCDGLVDEGTVAYDDDGDGYSEADGDCDDTSASTNPGAGEVLGNGVDDDCDGLVDEGTASSDDDNDGFSEAQGDCDDTNAGVYPGAPEIENGLDDDCNGDADEGLVDLDEDGFTVEDGDCDDQDGWVYPGADELCDRADNDCDGTADEGCDDEEVVPVDTGDTGAADTKGCAGCAAQGDGGGAIAGIAALALLAARRRGARRAA